MYHCCCLFLDPPDLRAEGDTRRDGPEAISAEHTARIQQAGDAAGLGRPSGPFYRIVFQRLQCLCQIPLEMKK